MKKQNPILKITSLAILLGVSLAGNSKAQVIINSDIINNAEVMAYIALKDLTPVASGAIEYFWFNNSDAATITTWTTASSWLSSALRTNNLLGSQAIGDGYDGTAGLFSGPVSIPSLSASAVGKSFAAAVTTSDGLLGVFKFSGVLPANTPPPNPASAVGAILADVGSSGVLVGGYNANGSFNFGGTAISGEAYTLVPEPSTGILLAIGSGLLFSLRRLKRTSI